MQSHRHGLNDLTRYGRLRIFFTGSEARVIVHQMKHGMLSSRQGGNRAALSSNPNGLLRCNFSSVIKCPLLSQTSGEGGKPLRAKIGHEFLSLEFGFKKIILAIWNLFLRDKFLVVANSKYRAANAHDVAVFGIDHRWRYRQYVLRRHP